jgi:GTP cyclohydrolase I
MKMRGVGKQNSTLITSALRGVFDTDIAARSEALRLIHPR